MFLSGTPVDTTVTEVGAVHDAIVSAHIFKYLHIGKVYVFIGQKEHECIC